MSEPSPVQIESPAQTCGPAARLVHLPVASGGEGPPGKREITRSKTSKFRFAVLIFIQLLMIIHLMQWWWTGTTTSPTEPSEAIQFTANGVLTVGAIFFMAVLVSTMFFGRWFCGWGCHVLLLQDTCSWMMKKCHISPTPFKSKLLMWFPLGLALYMFIWPVVLRLMVNLNIIHANVRPWTVSSQFTTADYWQTFPGPWIAVPFLLVCGFASVYFLGNKGFCTYGCPYGGFFTPLDKLAPGRIRVTDACEQCGHCTAACTSNVRVHEEVNRFGMVVDPGCMKCLDCVSVCPNDALYYGLGRPAIFAHEKNPSAPAMKKKRRSQLSWRQEITLTILFLIAFLILRDLYGVISILFAVGLALCITYLIWKVWWGGTPGEKGHSRLHRFQLRSGGRITVAGYAWSALTFVLVALTLHSGLVQYHFRLGRREVDRVNELQRQLQYDDKLTQSASMTLSAQAQDLARYALAHLHKADSISVGGIGLLPRADSCFMQAAMSAYLGDPQSAVKEQERGMTMNGEESDGASADLARFLMIDGTPTGRGKAEVYLRGVMKEHPDFQECARLSETLRKDK